MKKLIIAVLCGLGAGLAYISIMMLISAPFMLLIRMGLLEVLTDPEASQTVVGNIVGEMKDIASSVTTPAIIILAVQGLLFVFLGAVSFIFMTHVMRIFLAEDSYFRHLYDVVFFIVMIIPEILILLALFFNFSLSATLYIILGITMLIFVFVTIMAGKILPDLMKNKNRKYLLKTSIKD